MSSNLSRRLYRTLFWNPRKPHQHLSQLQFCSSLPLSDSDPPLQEQEQEQEEPQRVIFDRPLENGLDPGIYRAILVGKASGQKPLQKKLRSGTVVTLFSIGTGGIHNNRRPLQNENPADYANRCSVQWHRVSVYPQRLGNLVASNLLPGSLLYVEGNLETKLFADPVTGFVRRIREVAVRQNGRVLFLSQGGDADQQTQNNNLRAVGYY